MVLYPSGVGSDTTDTSYQNPGGYSANRVIQIVRWLEADQLCRDMRDRARSRHELHSMLTVPDLPPHMIRGDAVSINSPSVMWLLNSILADCRSFPTTTTLVPQGKYTKDQQDQGDEMEKWYAVKRAQLDDGGRNSHDLRWHQGCTSYGVMILHCGAAGEKDPWRVEVPDPLTCFFPIEGGPIRPSIMGRRYTLLVEEVQKRYSKKRSANDFNNKELKWDEGEWSWAIPIGEDQPVEAGDVGNLTTSRIGLPGVADNVEMMELYTPECVYHVALHGTIGADGSRKSLDGVNGQIVWKADTMTDGIPVVIVPGHVTPLRTPVERFQPTLWAPMQCKLAIDMIRAMRMTKAFNWKPDILVGQDPDMIAALKEAGVLQEPSNVQLAQGGPNIINMAGKPMLWNQPSDQDLGKLEASLTVEMNRYIDNQLAVTTAEVAKQATLGGIQLAIGVRKRQLSVMLSNLDWGWAEILRMIRASIKHYKDDFPLYAQGGERYSKGELQANSQVTISYKNIEAIDHEIIVSTASMTEEERRMLVQDWAYRQTLGLSTQVEGLEAAGYQDIADQAEKLAIDLALKHTTSGWAQQIDAVASDYIRTSGGILVTFGIPPTLGSPTGQQPNGAQQTGGDGRAPPATSTVTGGSTAGPPMIGAGGA